MMTEIDPTKIPQRYLKAALVCLDQGFENYGFVVLFDSALLDCSQGDRDLLIDALEKFCTQLRGRGMERVQ